MVSERQITHLLILLISNELLLRTQFDRQIVAGFLFKWEKNVRKLAKEKVN